MTGDDEPSLQRHGSVVLHLTSSNRKGVANALRRHLGGGGINTANPLSRSLIQTATNVGLGETLLMSEHETSADGHYLVPHEGLSTFLGVFVPCTCTIFGLVLFMRLGFVVGQAGVWGALTVVVGAFTICLLTVLSLCTLIASDWAAATTGGSVAAEDESFRRRDPGLYSALRKAVGPELGSALGLAFFLAFTVAAAFHIVGFAVLFSDTFSQLHSRVQVFPWNPPGTWVDVVTASGVLLLVGVVASRGVRFSALASLATLAAILVCLVTSLLCVLVPTKAGAYVNISTGLSAATFAANVPPELTPFNGFAGEDGRPSIMLMFVLVFPGFTGVLVGSNLSAHLRSPSRSIGKGSVASLAFVLATYCVVILCLGASISRVTLKTNAFVLSDLALQTLHIPIGHMGVALATLSSALSYFLGAPRLLQAVARDSGWPLLRHIVPPPAPSEPAAEPPRPTTATQSAHTASPPPPPREPLGAIAITYALCQLIIVLPGTINSLAPLVTGIFLLAFCLINLLAFLHALKPVSTSRVGRADVFVLQSRWLALFGFLASFLTAAAALANDLFVAGALGSGLLGLLLWNRQALYVLVASRREASVRIGAEVESAAAGASVEERVERAAAYVHDALAGRFRGVHWAVHSKSRIYAQRLLHSLRYVRALNLTAYLVLAFVERPSWCYSNHRSACGDPAIVVRFSMTGSWAISPAISQAIEAGCLALFGCEMGLKTYYMSARTFFYSPWHVLQMLLLVTSAAIVAVQAVALASSKSDEELLDRPQAAAMNYLNPLLRPVLFVALSRSVRRSLRSFVRVLPATADVFSLIVLLIVFFAALGCLLFSGVPELHNAFGHLGSSFVSTFILLTTANFPDIMLKVYKTSAVSAFFFVVFLVVGVFMLINLMLAAVVRNYEIQTRAAEATARHRRDCAIQAAFTLLDLNSNGFVDLVELSALLQRVSEPVFSLFDGEMSRALDTARTMHSLQRMLEGDAALPVRGLGPTAFAECVLALQKDHSLTAHVGELLDDEDDDTDAEATSQLSLGGSGPDGDRSEGGLRHRASSTREVRWSDEGAPYIDERRWSDERRQVVVIESEDGMRATIGAPLPSPRSTGSPAVRMVRRAVRSARFDLAIDAVLVLNMALVLSEIELLLSGEWDALRAIEASTAPLFSLVFVGEAALKLWVLGYHRFFRRRDQTYALIVAGLTAIADVINFVMDGQLGTDDGLSDDVEVRIALGCRLLRLPRLVFSLQRGNPFFSRLLKELNAFGGLFGLIVVLFTFYGQLGVALFGGKIRVDTFPNATDGGDGGLFIPLIGASIPPDYAYCNFNDFPSALLTLFYQLMINNWFLTMELAVLVTRTDWARVYFVSWYWLAAICMTNLVVAQILQVSQVAAGGAHEGAREHAANGHEGARHTAQGARARVAVGSAPAALSAHVTAALRRLAQETPESTPHPRQPTPLRRQATAGPVLQSSVSQLLVATAEGGTAAPAAARTDADCTTQPALDSAAASVGSHGL